MCDKSRCRFISSASSLDETVFWTTLVRCSSHGCVSVCVMNEILTYAVSYDPRRNSFSRQDGPKSELKVRCARLRRQQNCKFLDLELTRHILRWKWNSSLARSPLSLWVARHYFTRRCNFFGSRRSSVLYPTRRHIIYGKCSKKGTVQDSMQARTRWCHLWYLYQA